MPVLSRQQHFYVFMCENLEEWFCEEEDSYVSALVHSSQHGIDFSSREILQLMT